MKNNKKLALRGGLYSLLVTAVVLAILIAVNLFAAALPATMTKLDISSAKLYSITGNTKAVVNNLEKDVTIYWIVQADQEDSILENLLAKYDSLSDHIDVVKKNPDVYPTFAKQYTNKTVNNNSLVVESEDRYRFIAYDDIYVSESNMYSYSYTTSFDGEGAITSAIDYVVSDDLPVIYTLSGHGEEALPSTFAEQVEKENIETRTLSLLTVDEIPQDAACLMIYSPQSDISDEEAAMLLEYVAAGGKLLVMAGPVEDGSLTNLNSVLENYGVTVAEGIVIDPDRSHYAFQRPYILIPDMRNSDFTNSLLEEGYSSIIPLAAGLIVPDNSDVSEILVTSYDAYSKVAGYELQTYEMEDGDIEGSFAVGVSVDKAGEGRILWFSSSAFLTDTYNAYSSGANGDLAMNALSALIGEREAISIRSKSLNYNYLTITESEGSLLKAVLIGILPLAYLFTGIFIYTRTRRKQNEAL